MIREKLKHIGAPELYFRWRRMWTPTVAKIAGKFLSGMSLNCPNENETEIFNFFFLQLSVVGPHASSSVHWFSCYYMITHGQMGKGTERF